MKEITNLTGQKIENWTVVEMDHKNAHGVVYWLCKCDCGYEKKMRTNSLLSKKYLWCPGCSKRPRKRNDISGQRFGRLTVIEIDRIIDNITMWKCRCDCGNITSVSIANLRGGHTKSCGCLARENGYANIKNRYLNEYKVIGDTVYVILTNGETMLCDVDDWERLKIYTWRVNGRGYAFRSRMKGERSSDIRFHSCVIEKKDNMVIDHINRNRLDNRKCNLRLCTIQVNTINRSVSKRNKSGYTGVTKHRNKWIAYIGVNHKNIKLGSYDCLEDAIKARKDGEEKYHKPILEKY